MRPLPGAARGSWRSEAAGIFHRLRSSARNVAVLIRKTQPGPTATVRTPATAGPIILATLKEALLSATALGR